MAISIAQPLLLYEMGQRTRQEDAVFPKKDEATPHTRVFVLCDGMGGLQQGDVASALVCETVGREVHRSLFWQYKVKKALRKACARLDALDRGYASSMGTTLVMLVLGNTKAQFAHVGDSRGYLISPSRRLAFHTHDHSYVQTLCDLGQITESEMLTHPKRNILERAIMPHRKEKVRIEFTDAPELRAGDYLMLCSDGMIEQLTDRDLLALFSDSALSDAEKVEQLRIRTRYNQDNHTAYVIPIIGVSHTVWRIVLCLVLLACLAVGFGLYWMR